MNLSAKKVLFINLNKKTFEAKSFPDLNKYIGGVGLGLKLLSGHIEQEPVILSVGPLNGFFPYASKTSIVINTGNVVEDLYIGGSLSFRIKFSGIDSIVMLGSSNERVILNIQNEEVTFHYENDDINSLGLPGKRSILTFEQKRTKKVSEENTFDKQELLLDNYFTPPEDLLKNKLLEKNVKGIVFTGSKAFDLKNTEKYGELYNQLLERSTALNVEKDIHPSCSGCPMGCAKSKTGEIGGNVLAHSLVACAFADKIYSDVSVVFSCLHTLGYDYTHEDIENLPRLIEEVLQLLS